MSKKYAKLEDIPAHIFSNRILTDSPSPELNEYLRYMHDNHREDLRYLHRRALEYKDYGGSYFINFDRWLSRLDNGLKRQGY